MNFIPGSARTGCLFALTLMMAACTPKVGSERWCAHMEEKPKGDWTMNQAQDYAKHCLFESDEETQEE